MNENKAINKVEEFVEMFKKLQLEDATRSVKDERLELIHRVQVSTAESILKWLKDAEVYEWDI